jgi:hypothetical protein
LRYESKTPSSLRRLFIADIVNNQNVPVPRQERDTPTSDTGIYLQTLSQFAIPVGRIKLKKGPRIRHTESFSFFGPDQVVRHCAITAACGDSLSAIHGEVNRL